MITVTAWLAEAATDVADALTEDAARVADGVACCCWLLLAMATETIADAGTCSMVAKP